MKVIIIDDTSQMIVGEINTDMMPIVGVDIRYPTSVNRLYEKPQIKLSTVKEIEIDYVSNQVIVNV